MGWPWGDETTTTNNDNRTSNVSIPVASQSNEGPSTSVQADGNVTLRIEDLTEEAFAGLNDSYRDLVYSAGDLTAAGERIVGRGSDLVGDVLDATVDLAYVSGDSHRDNLDTHRDNLDFLDRTFQSVGGAVKDLIDTTLINADRNSERFIDYTKESGRDVIDYADDTNKRFVDYTSESQDNLFDAVERNTKLVNDVVDQVVGVVDRAADNNSALSASVLDYSEDLNTENIAFLSSTFDRFIGSVEDMSEQASYDREQNAGFVTAVLGEFVGSVEDLNEQASYDRADNIAAITELGQVVATGGESLQTNLNKLIGVGSVIVLGLVAWQAVRS